MRDTNPLTSEEVRDLRREKWTVSGSIWTYNTCTRVHRRISFARPRQCRDLLTLFAPVARQNQKRIWNEWHTRMSCNLLLGWYSAVAEFWRRTGSPKWAAFLYTKRATWSHEQRLLIVATPPSSRPSMISSTPSASRPPEKQAHYWNKILALDPISI